MLVSALLFTALAADPQPRTFPLWPGKAPLAVGDSSFDKPELTLYKPAKSNGTAIVVCPGGGYGTLAIDHEGRQVAAFLNKLGVTAFVLKYRVANKERPGPLGEAPLRDAQRAIRTVRARAKEYGIAADRIGIWGFSAGGHLASTVATHFDAGQPEGDAIDRVSSRPDFVILAYPVITFDPTITHAGSRRNLIGEKPDPQWVEFFSNEKHVTKDTPPVFLFHTTADTVVPVENAIRFYHACRKAGVPVEMHIYEKGKHGVGLGRDPKWTGGETSVATWPDRLVDWLKSRQLLPSP
jgi:acetyl esterase/lipase